MHPTESYDTKPKCTNLYRLVHGDHHVTTQNKKKVKHILFCCYRGFCSDLLLDTLHSSTTQITVQLRGFFVALRPNVGHGLLIREVSRSHTTTHHNR